MDFGDISENIPLIVTIIGVIIFQIFMRRRRPRETTHAQIVQNLLAEVKLNLRLAEIYTFDWRAKKFTTTAWQRNRNKLDFLEQPAQTALSDSFIMADDFNQQISAAKKYKSTSYMASVDVDRLIISLTKGQEELEHWMESKTGSSEPEVKMPGIFGDFTGRG